MTAGAVPGPVSGPGDAGVEGLLAEVLGNHYDTDGDCWCGWVLDVTKPGNWEDQHSAHLAEALLPVVQAEVAREVEARLAGVRALIGQAKARAAKYDVEAGNTGNDPATLVLMLSLATLENRHADEIRAALCVAVGDAGDGDGA